MTSPYEPVVFPFNVALVLEFLSYVSYGGYPFDYSGDLSLNTEAQYNALTWNDAREKPEWPDIVANNPGAYQVRSEREKQRYYWDVQNKVGGIAAGATANSTDAQLRDRSTHTGTQAMSTVTGLSTAMSAKQDASSALDAVVAAEISNNEMILGDVSGVKKLLTTSTGRSLMAATDAASARSTIGAGTSSFSGSYTDLTNKPTIPTILARSFTNNASRSIVTGTGATGFLVSSTRDAAVNYNITTSSTATIGGASSVTVVLEIAPTNSATAGDWVEISRFSNGQTISLAVVLQSVQTGAGNLGGIVPAGYYAKLRSIISGTASASYNTGQEVLL